MPKAEKRVKVEKVSEDRVKNLSRFLEVNGEKLYYDFAKTHFTEPQKQKIIDEMLEKDVLGEIKAMFEGGPINFTEKRSVLHTSLRDKHVIECLKSDGECTKEAVLDCICQEFRRIKNFVNNFLDGKMIGVTGKPLNTVVNIGIGGSDLGPRVVCEALEEYKVKNVTAHFVSNVDPSELISVLNKVKIDETLFIVVSKTFTTQETLANANLAIQIGCENLGVEKKDLISKHFVAVTAKKDEAVNFGIESVFAMWDFVGGRYSLWSAAGISIALYLGCENFLKLLTGASAVDENFREDPMKSPELLHALTEIFYSRKGYPTKCIIPYDFYLRNFYTHIQQLDMESNGKSAGKLGKIKEQTGMIVWGGVGTNSQHSFFQLIHQGTHKILLEFLCPVLPIKEYGVDGVSHHTLTVANCLAQSEALFVGKKSEDLHKNFDGGKPSISILYSKLTPEILGALIAHYEHKVLVVGLLYEINSFDQFGVQLGKTLAKEVHSAILTDADLRVFTESTGKNIEIVKLAKK